MSDCNSLSGGFPWPPANAMAMSAFHSSDTDIRWDDPSTLNTGPASGVLPNSTVTAALTIVVNGTPTVATAATGSFQVVNAPIPAGEYLSVDGVAVLSVNGNPVGADEFDGSSPDQSVIATRIAAAINAGSLASAAWGIVTASASGSLVSLTAASSGTSGNNTSLASSTALLVPSGTTLTGGAVGSVLMINGSPLTGVDGSRSPGSDDFDVNDASNSIVAAINDPKNTFSQWVEAVWAGGCVYVRSKRPGQFGNKIPVSSNTETLVVSHTETSGGSGIPCTTPKNNSGWDILGVNIYRSDTGERGPYFRVNRVPVMAQFYRDRTDVVEVPAEIIPWNGGWIFQGNNDNAPNDNVFRLRTRYRPIVKAEGNAVHADSPFDVEVYVDGARVQVGQVFGPTGEIDLLLERVWDPSTEKFVDPPVPTATSTVSVRYFYRRNNELQNALDNRWKVFYRLTTVARDTTGTSPSGLIETPLEYSPPISPMESEQLDYIWREAINRNRWILEQGGERVKLFIRRTVGNPCDCHWDARLLEYAKQPINNCEKCYGTGYIGGYEGPYDIIIGPDDSERRVEQTASGRKLENSYEVWIGPTPIVSQRDFVVKQNGERFAIGPVRRTQIRGRTLQQAFNIGYLQMGDIRYKVPMGELQRLPWPETRVTFPELSPCEDSPPHPVGADYQATPMATEKNSIPDGREQRGRTPVYQNITYGGKGR